PKESIQKKRHPMPLGPCAPQALNGVFRKGIPALAKNARHPCRAPDGQIRSKPPVFGAATGEENPTREEKLLDKFVFWVSSSIAGCCRR
ncbi:hypothetical protein, partial [Methylomonas koyamae]|uniref:hypothetical protein n=1 Tax=Methylomonas koyamae TaxID=702114 RepID=UPI001E3A1477